MGYHKGEDTLMEGAVEMYQWERQIQSIVDEIDRCIRQQDSEALTLQALSRRLGYSESYTTRKFGEISGMRLRDYPASLWRAPGGVPAQPQARGAAYQAAPH